MSTSDRPRMDADGRGLRHGALTERIAGIFYDVYNELGFGFLESVYEQAMMVCFRQAGLSAVRQAPVLVHFRGEIVGDFRSDIVVEDAVLLELKAARSLAPEHEAQILNYLRATPIEVAMLLNFGPKPEFRRFVFDNTRKQIRVDPRQSAAPLGSSREPHPPR